MDGLQGLVLLLVKNGKIHPCIFPFGPAINRLFKIVPDDFVFTFVQDDNIILWNDN